MSGSAPQAATTVRRAVLDLGSNSFHVLVADVDDDGALTPVLREREMLHLGAVVAEHGDILPGAADEAVDVTAHLVELARRAGADEPIAVATSALRDATNGPAVLDRLGAAVGRPVQVLDGEDEARLGYLGVRASVALRSEPALVLDLGGGSLELAVGTGSTVSWAASTPLGVMRCMAELVRHDPPSVDEVAALRRRVAETLASYRDELGAHDPGVAVAIGGTVRALGRVVAAEDGTWLPASVNQLTVPTDVLARVRDELTTLSTDDRRQVPGMKEKRADHLHVAAVILVEALTEIGVPAVTVSDWGLREGVLLDDHGVDTLVDAPTLRRGAVDRMRRAFVPDDAHLPHVAHLATRLFDATGALHGCDPADRELLEAAALLHDVGEALAMRRHHKHGAYLVENAELRGFSPAEVAVLTTLVRFHKSRGIDRSFAPFAALGPDRQEAVTRLLPLLQLADGLDRTRDQTVRDVTARQRGGTLRLALHGTGLHLAATEVARKTALFERTYGVDVQLVDRADA